MITDRIFPLIMAGGKGTRLWPLATASRPKAFLSFDETRLSLLQHTVSRLSQLVTPESIFVVAGKAHEAELLSHINDVPVNVILEPMGKNTLPCIGFAALYIRRRDESGTIVILPGEQLIKNEARFRCLIQRAAEVAQDQKCIVTLGINPAEPATRFGYIKLGERLSNEKGIPVFKSRGFTEKPDERRAREFLSSGKYLWNSGIFILPIQLLFDMISEFAPDIYQALLRIDSVIGTISEEETIDRVYSDMPSISIDYAIMEQVDDVLVIPASIGWNDMGTWPEVADTWKIDDQFNSCFGRYMEIDSAGCIIYSPDKLVAAIGVQDMIVVETPEALLLCHKDRADDVKKLVQMLDNQKDRKRQKGKAIDAM